MKERNLFEKLVLRAVAMLTVMAVFTLTTAGVLKLVSPRSNADTPEQEITLVSESFVPELQEAEEKATESVTVQEEEQTEAVEVTEQSVQMPEAAESFDMEETTEAQTDAASPDSMTVTDETEAETETVAAETVETEKSQTDLPVEQEENAVVTEEETVAMEDASVT